MTPLKEQTKKEILIIHENSYLDVASGVLSKLSHLPGTLLAGKGGYIAGTSLYETLASLNQRMAGVPRWRMSVTVAQRRAYVRSGQIALSGSFQVSYLSFQFPGFHGSGRKRVQNGVRWDVVNLEAFMDLTEFTLGEKMEATLSLLTLCESRGVTLTRSRGTLAKKLLKASPDWNNLGTGNGPRWYGQKRKPAPKWINDEARKHSPGNHYSTSNKIHRAVSMSHCYYIDQTSAHHTIARDIRIPHPNYLRGRGYVKQALLEDRFPKWLSHLPSDYVGLFCCHIEIHHIPAKLAHLYPKWVTERKAGHHIVWLYSPDIRLMENDHLVNLAYITAGFCTTEADPVLPEYATWALEQLKLPGKRHTKATLLAAYGMLQFNPLGWKSYRYWGGTAQSKGQPVEVPVAGWMKEVEVRFPDFVQLDITNVCARGMIESETRTRSLEYARELHSQGYHIAQVYADALVVETDTLPFTPPGWRVDKSLTNVLIPSVNSIVSDQMVKRPGLSRDDSDRVLQARRPFRQARMRREALTRS